MAVADVLQRLLNAAGFRIRQVGAAQAGDDAARLNVPYSAVSGAGPFVMDGLVRSLSVDPAGAAAAVTLPDPALWPGQTFFVMRKAGSAGTLSITPASGGLFDVNEAFSASVNLTAAQGFLFTSDGFNYSFR